MYGRIVGVSFAVVCLFLPVAGGRASAAPIDPPPLSPLNLRAESLGMRTAKEGIPSLDSALNDLLRAASAGQSLQDSASRSGLSLEGDRVHVTLTARSEGEAGAVLRAVERLGGEVTARYKTWIDVSLPVDALAELGRRADVRFIQRLVPVFPLGEPPVSRVEAVGAGTYVTQGVYASNADDWHAAGFTGTGVSIGILDSFQGSLTARDLGELPFYYTLGTLDTSSPHGTACAEIIHDMAPGATLTLASPASAVDMASKIVQLAQTGRRIISSSMGFYNTEPGDGTGPVSDAINTARNTYDTLYVQAAGNQASYHWDGGFVDTDADGFHEFAPGVEINQLGNLPAGRLLFLQLRWNNWPVTNQDYDLYVVRWTGSAWQPVLASENIQSGTQPPTEGIGSFAPTTALYGVVISRYSATGGQVLDLMGHNAPTFQHKVSDRSLVDPATAAHSFSVAAVDVGSYNLEPYSSWGPTHGPGGALTGGISKPRIASYANVDTWSYGAGGFNGTSSATPHVAGAAALVLSAYPNSTTAADVASLLEGQAIDLGDPGHDLKFGAGRLHLGVPPGITGSIRVDIVPPEAAAAGAQWRIQGVTGWLPSGATVSGLEIGLYGLDFSTIPGWIAPPSFFVGLSYAVPDIAVQNMDPYLRFDSPGSLQAFGLTAGSIQLGWLDRSNGEQSFELERKLGVNGTYAHLADLPADTTSWVDDDGLGSSVYCYRMRAHSATLDSGYSNEACAFAGSNTATDFYTLVPCRVLDTRQQTAILSGETRVYTMAGSCGIPADARAISVNLTAVGPTGSGHVKLFPADVLTIPSAINFVAGRNRANNGIVPLSYDGTGQIAVQASVTGNGTVHVVIDVNGYFQ